MNWSEYDDIDAAKNMAKLIEKEKVIKALDKFSQWHNSQERDDFKSHEINDKMSILFEELGLESDNKQSDEK